MPYSIQYDISGLLVLGVVLSLFYLKSTLPSHPNRTFSLLVLTIFVSVLFKVINQLLFPHIQLNRWAVLILYGMNLFLNSLIPIPFALYTLALANAEDRLSQRNMRLLLLTPLLIITVLIGISFFYPLVFTLDETHSPAALPLMGFIYGSTLYYTAAGIIILLRNKHSVPLISIRILYCTAILSLASSIIQACRPLIQIQSITLALSVLIISLTVQKSEDTTDAISGLYNQTAFETMNHKRFKTGEKFHIVGIVFDDLPFLISTLGIRHINEVLKQSAGFIKSTLKNTHVYHFNDGKFCIVFPDYDLETVYTCIEAVKERFLLPWAVNSISVKIFPRTSIISCPEDADSTESVIELFELLSSDDKYKMDGIIFASSMDTTIRKRSAYLDRTVKNAIIEGLIDVFYQPIFCTKKQKIIGAEALIRMKDEKGKYVSPEEFIPVAEKNGSILRIGEFVFEKVCRLLSEIKPEEYGIQKIDINLSVVQCMQEMLAEQILNIANLYRIPFSLLNLEITETAAAYSQETLKLNMQKLSDAGIELSLDDYGSGYSNMGYMINLPFDMIKIDKGIVWNAFKDEKSYTALAYTISMINALKMTVLAEGIETHEQAESLTSLGCHYLQGYYYSHPLPKDTFLQLLNHQKIEIAAECLTFSQGGIPGGSSAMQKHRKDIIPLSMFEENIDEVEELDSFNDLEVESSSR